MPSIFISYRRSDTTAGYASWLYERFAARFGSYNVLMDIDSLALGVDFVEQLDRALLSTDIALILIGPGWAHAVDDQGRLRLNDPDDFVRMEVAAPLRASLRVIPVLADGPRVPPGDVLPEDLKSLCRRQPLIFDRHGGIAIAELLQTIEQAPAASRRPPPAPGPTRRIRAPNRRERLSRYLASPAPPPGRLAPQGIGRSFLPSWTRSFEWAQSWRLPPRRGATNNLANIQANFRNACEANASPGRCDCALRWMGDHVSLSRFQADEQTSAKTGKLPGYYFTAVKACGEK